MAKPNVEITPATIPIVKLIPGLATIPEGAPIATPPAKVAFKISSIENFSLTKALIINAAKQLPVNEIIVLEIMRDFWNGLAGKYPALKDGQNIHKNSVPIIANVEFMAVVSAFFVGNVFLLKMKLTVSPK